MSSRMDGDGQGESLFVCTDVHERTRTSVQWSAHNAQHCLVARLVNSHTTADLLRTVDPHLSEHLGTHPCSYKCKVHIIM